MTVTEKGYAKINLTFDITGKRADGYHTVNTVMQTVSLYDELILTESGGITLECSDSKLPTGEDNLAYRGALAFFKHTGIKGGVKIELKKSIPSAAGLAGGSADAAAVVRGLNKLYAAGLNAEELCDIGAGLGADVPFCMVGGAVAAVGTGTELIERFDILDGVYYVIAKGAEGISTAKMYAEYDRADFVKPIIKTNKMTAALRARDRDRAILLLGNVFEPICFAAVPEVADIKSRLLNLGANGALMTGSGSAVYGIFDNYNSARKAAEELRALGCFASVAEATDAV